MLKVLKTLFRIFAVVIGLLFVVYFWNLDQKLMAWAYTQVNRIFDNKKTDIRF